MRISAGHVYRRVLGVRGHAIKSASDPRGHDALFQCVNLIIGRLFAQSYAARGDVIALRGIKLVIGFIVMLCGMLTCAGVGLFVMVQSVLFVLNMSPMVAFPIMMTAGLCNSR